MTVSPQGTLIWQRFPNVSCLQNMLREKKRDSFDPQRVNLFGEDSVCMVNLLGTLQVIVFFSSFFLQDCLLRLFQKRSFVLSSEHETQNVTTIGTLLDQFKLSCK